MAIREYPGCRLVRVHDGDTIFVDWDLGRETWAHEESIRLNGLDTQELKPGGLLAKEWGGLLAKEWVAWWFAMHCPDGALTLRTVRVKGRDKREKYGRYLGTIIAPDGHCLNEDLITAGYGRPWKGQGPKPWTNELVA